MHDRPTILFVEDDAVSRDLLCSLVRLKYPGIVLLQAGNGEEGVAQCREHCPDIIVTDISMPVMDGIRMARAVKETDSTAYIIAITAHSEKKRLAEARASGIDHFLLKPFDRRQLYELIDGCLAGKEPATA